MRINVLDIKIDDISMEDALRKVEGWLSKSGKYYIVTPNPEIIMLAQKDDEFKNILNKADLAIADGVGLKLSGRIKNTLPGVDLMEELVRIAAEKAYRVGLLGGRDKVVQETARHLIAMYPKLKISFVSAGGIINEDFHANNYQLPTTDLLFVAFGAPKQEKWIATNLDKIPVKVAMGVGGAFDYYSGRIPRAPKWVRGLGMEWLFRLIVQPWRIRRQLVLIQFAFLILRRRFGC